MLRWSAYFKRTLQDLRLFGRPADDPGDLSRGQTLNDVPQPHEEAALGFWTWNDEPTISST